MGDCIFKHNQISYFYTTKSQEQKNSADSPYRPLPHPPAQALLPPPPTQPPLPLGRSDNTAGEQIVSSSGHIRDVYSEGSPDVLSKKQTAPLLFMSIVIILEMQCLLLFVEGKSKNCKRLTQNTIFLFFLLLLLLGFIGLNTFPFIGEQRPITTRFSSSEQNSM